MSAARCAAALGLVAIAIVHLLDMPHAYDDGTYVVWLYSALVAACGATAGLLTEPSWPPRPLSGAAVWVAVLTLALTPLGGYLLSRTVGLPGGLRDDIGRWGEPLGIVSLAIEGGLILLSLGVLACGRRAQNRQREELWLS